MLSEIYSFVEFKKIHLDQKCGYIVNVDALSSINEPYFC